MAWQPGAAPNFQTRTLPHQIYIFNHPIHGRLKVTRANKAAGTNQINYRLKLTAPGGAVIRDNVSLFVDNDDQGALSAPVIGMGGQQPPRVPGRSTVGYGMIDISSMGGMGIIYLVHHVFALTGRDLRVSAFLVAGIVNPAMDQVCQQCGMGAAVYGNYYQAVCTAVVQRSYARAQHHGWQ